MSNLKPGIIQIIDDDEAEKVDFVVCIGAEQSTAFTDNVFTGCALCQKALQHRPYVPKAPPKICIDCMIKESAKHNG